jgi:hypothetical protein
MTRSHDLPTPPKIKGMGVEVFKQRSSLKSIGLSTTCSA